VRAAVQLSLLVSIKEGNGKTRDLVTSGNEIRSHQGRDGKKKGEAGRFCYVPKTGFCPSRRIRTELDFKKRRGGRARRVMWGGSLSSNAGLLLHRIGLGVAQGKGEIANEPDSLRVYWGPG